MSKIGKKPIVIPEGVQVVLNPESRKAEVRGPLGVLEISIGEGVRAKIENGVLNLFIENERKQTKSNWGTSRALLMNAVKGVTQGFEKTLILEGVGFKIIEQDGALIFSLGFSHPIKIIPPQGVAGAILKNSILKIRGADKALVGQFAAKVRALKKAEPYKGKGFRYENEIIRRKAGKKAAAASSPV